LKDAPVLVMDEPTSALDTENRGGLLVALEALMRDRTSIIIAHRLSTIRTADTILVVRDGRIFESGIARRTERTGRLLRRAPSRAIRRAGSRGGRRVTPVERSAGARQTPSRRPRANRHRHDCHVSSRRGLWDYGQYAVGLERLGWDVFYLEDTGSRTYDPDAREYSDDSAYGIEFLRRSLPELSPTLASRWHVRTADDLTHGTSVEECRGAIDDADLFLTVLR
jgi:energy-coupling factor transporter ATP-binding protein EcfA2